MKKQGNKQHEELAEMLKAIAHPERVAILNLICTSGSPGLTVTGLYTKLKLLQPVVSRHLGIMKKSGILIRQTEGVNAYYTLDDENPYVQCLLICFTKALAGKGKKGK